MSAGFPFNANPGDQLTVNFNSNVPVDFYLMSASQYQRVPPATSLCVLGFIPAIPSLISASYRTSYSLSWSPTLAGQYFIVLMDLQPATASVFLSASVTSQQVESVVVNATTTTTMTSVYSQVSSMLAPATNTTAPSQALSVGLSSETIQWVAVILVLAALGVVFVLFRKKSAKTG
jgi:disulfide bond formation protein DsbB